LGAAWSRYNQLALSGLELSIPDAMFMQHFVHGLGTESSEYLDMTYGGVFLHYTVEPVVRKQMSTRMAPAPSPKKSMEKRRHSKGSS
jgi:hypothetical protein